jgi:hypothetical protein
VSDGVRKRDLWVIIAIAVVLLLVVALFALLCPGAWETGRMLEEMEEQESRAVPAAVVAPA